MHLSFLPASPTRFLLALLLVTPIMQAAAQTQYIDDTLLAPLRSGKGTEYRILHKGLRSGTPVEVLEVDQASGYSRVLTQGGIEGWLPTRFLTDQPIARVRLERLSREHEQLQARVAELQSSNEALQSSNTQLQAELDQTREQFSTSQTELTNIRRVSENALQLDRSNRQLRETNETLKNEVEVLTSENLRLRDKNEQESMMLGAGMVLLGVLIAVILPMFKRQKRDTW